MNRVLMRKKMCETSEEKERERMTEKGKGKFREDSDKNGFKTDKNNRYL